MKYLLLSSAKCTQISAIFLRSLCWHLVLIPAKVMGRDALDREAFD